MWAGLVANIPAGWLLCNGANGTPDLRDRFIVGAANGANPGATGGIGTHTHAAHTGIISHTHTTDSLGAHVHAQQRFPTATGGSTGFTVDTSMSGTPAAANDTASAGAHTHTAAAPAGAVSELGHDSLDNRPPFYALCFIQKT
jgi:hypothetical protein